MHGLKIFNFKRVTFESTLILKKTNIFNEIELNILKFVSFSYYIGLEIIFNAQTEFIIVRKK